MSECTLARMYIWPNVRFPKTLFSGIDACQIWPNGHISENLFSRNYILSKIHFLETIFHSKNYTMFRLFISNIQNKLLGAIKKRRDNS